MTSMGVQAVLAILVLFTATVKAEGVGGVTFWKTKFTMHCPQDGDWFDKDLNKIQNVTKTLEYEYENSKKGLYHCTYGEDAINKYYFYVKGKVCENCYELDAYLFLTAIVVDVIVTGLLMLIIYKFTKNKSSPGLGHTSKASARSEAHGPAVSSSDYEMLNARTRSQDTYSVVNRTG